jgi:hypothetical protein
MKCKELFSVSVFTRSVSIDSGDRKMISFCSHSPRFADDIQSRSHLNDFFLRCRRRVKSLICSCTLIAGNYLFLTMSNSKKGKGRQMKNLVLCGWTHSAHCRTCDNTFCCSCKVSRNKLGNEIVTKAKRSA